MSSRWLATAGCLRGLASVSKKYGTPTGAIVLMMVVMAGFIALNEFWEDLFALPGLPHYFSIFVWASTFGGFALVVVYLLMSVGAFRGLADHGNMAGVYIASIVGIALTGGGDLRRRSTRRPARRCWRPGSRSAGW